MTSRQTLLGGAGKVAIVTAVVLPVSCALGMQYDLTPAGTQTLDIVGDFGGTAKVSDYFEQPTGTGVFKPFLTLDANGQTSTGSKKIEQAYNTDGFAGMYLDQLRPQWNNLLRISDLATISYDSVDYFAFILDANEPGGNKSIISIDNIRIYTSAVDNTASVAGDTTKLDDLGTLRWAMNNPLSEGPPNDLNGFNVDKWIKLDASQENVEQGANNSNGGSGKGDMVVYVPTSAFGSSLGTDDYVWFYNLNGVHYSMDKNLASESGYEEWRAVVRIDNGPGPGPGGVPDGGSTLALFGLGLAAVGLIGKQIKSAPVC